jgi:broad specificity phosphatase PhoE
VRLWLIRHGETEHNIKRVFQGQLDTPLTATGVRQARLTAVALGGVTFQQLYSSDLRRAYDTARPIAHGQGIPIVGDARLRELHYGVLQGVAYTEFRSVLEAHGAAEAWGGGVFSLDGNAPPGGESLADLVARTTEFVSDVARAASDNDDLAIVTHGGTIRTIMTELLGLPPSSRSAFALVNCGVTCFTGGVGAWQLEFHNRVFWGDGLEQAHSTV